MSKFAKKKAKKKAHARALALTKKIAECKFVHLKVDSALKHDKVPKLNDDDIIKRLNLPVTQYKLARTVTSLTHIHVF
jgi:hypothetical protein